MHGRWRQLEAVAVSNEWFEKAWMHSRSSVSRFGSSYNVKAVPRKGELRAQQITATLPTLRLLRLSLPTLPH